MKTFGLLAAIPLAVGLSSGSPLAAAEWSYEGETGPGSWGDLSPEFAACKNGTQQSPVDIAGAVDAALEDVEIHWKPAEWKVINNGHTI